MAEITSIEWADSTFNPWIGCTKVSPACDHCYAERTAKRMQVVWGPGQPRKRTAASTWAHPIAWNRREFYKCPECGWRGDAPGAVNGMAFCPQSKCAAPLIPARRRVFCASLADVFDNEVPAQWRADLFSLIAQTPNLDWLLLTKRIGNVAAMLDRIAFLGTVDSVLERMPLPNVWLGITVVNQEEADRDIPKLLATPAARRFLSMEPLLGPVNLGRYLLQCCGHLMPGNNHGVYGTEPDYCCGQPEPSGDLDWVIVGGESGPNARPMHPDWVRSLRDQCAAAGVAYTFKQWGEWRPPVEGEEFDTSMGRAQRIPAFIVANSGTVHCFENDSTQGGGAAMLRVGKNAAGRLLDGVEHNGVPS